MDTIGNFLALTGIIILAVLSPGPSFVGVTRHFLRFGLYKAVIFNAGIAIGESVLSGSVLLGLSSFLLENHWAYLIFRSLSGLYLIWIGFSMIRAAQIIVLKEDQEMIKKTNSLLAGVSIGVSNPKSLIFDAAIFSSFVSAKTTAIEKGAMWLWLMFLTFLCYSLICGLFSIYRQKMLKYFVYIEHICGAALIILGGKLLYSIME